MNPKSQNLKMALPDLPPEILINIFSRLPKKSVGACRCLSKYWNAELSSRNFTKFHLSRQTQRESLVLIDVNKSLHIVSPPINADAVSKRVELPTKYGWNEVLGCCNGLVLLLNRNDRIYLANPVTMQLFEIPDSPMEESKGLCTMMYGFGYDNSSEDFKIVMLSYFKVMGSKTFVHVYSLKMGVWRKVGVSPYRHDGFIDNVPLRSAYVNGAIHWMVRGMEHPHRPIIGAFDLAREVFDEILVPEAIANNEEELLQNDLFVLGGCLCIVDDGGYVGTVIDMWILKEYGLRDSWTKFSVDRGEWNVYEIKPFCLLENEDVVSLCYAVSFVISNLNDGKTRDLMIDGARASYFFDGGAFMESLFSPMGNIR